VTVAGIPPSASGGELERIRTLVGRHFLIYDTRFTPRSVIFLIQTDPRQLDAPFDALRQDLWAAGYIVQIRSEGGEYLLEVVPRPSRRIRGLLINWALLAATLVTATVAGAFLWVAYEGATTLSAGDFLYGGLFFAAPLMAILGFHEVAHYLVARRNHVEASLPFFIPMPPPFVIFGTFGAFISIREPFPDRRALLEIGAAGPLAGFALAIPVTLAGLWLSVHAPSPPPTDCGPVFLGVPYGNLLLGSSLLFSALTLFFPSGLVNLNPLAIAGWVGLLVTAINLLPAGQLDGGHIFRALLGRYSFAASIAAVAALFVLGFFYNGWFIFALVIILLGLRHPPPLNDLTPLSPSRKALGVLAVAVLLTGFVLIPIGLPTGSYSTTPAVTVANPGTGNVTNATLSFGVINNDVVAHAFYVSFAMTEVSVCSSLNRCTVLNGSALQEYLANLTWTVEATGLSSTSYHGSPFTLGQALDIPAGGTARVVVVVFDRSFAYFAASATISEACAGVQGLSAGSPTKLFFGYPPT
jgi:membrane-associated protease RseP (regulator of RpoE activity)